MLLSWPPAASREAWSDLRRFTLRPLLASMVAKIDNDHRIAHAERELIASHLKTRVLDPLVRGEYAHIVYDTRHVEQPIEHHDDDRFTDASSDIESTSGSANGLVIHQHSEQELLEAKAMLLED